MYFISKLKELKKEAFVCASSGKKAMSNIQCQLAVSAIAKELAPNVQGMQFCYRKNSKVLRFV